MEFAENKRRATRNSSGADRQLNRAGKTASTPADWLPGHSPRQGNLENLVSKRPARHANLRDFTLFFPEQALADRAGRQDLILVVIFVPGAYEVIDLLFGKVEIAHANEHAEDHAID